jgi:15-cis-phytoene synthase
MSGQEAEIKAQYSHCDAHLHEFDRDRWLANLFAKAELRQHLNALYAFNTEISRIRDIVSEPMLGEIRLQWWRDAISSANDSAKSHPIAGALLNTIKDFNLPRDAFTNLLDARVSDLYDDAFPTLNALEGYCGETSSILLRLAAIILNENNEPGGADACGHGGVALAITGQLRSFAWEARRGQTFVPTEILAKNGINKAALVQGPTSVATRAVLTEVRKIARNHLNLFDKSKCDMAPASRAALLPVSLCASYLKQMDKSGYDPFSTPIELPQWRRQWTLWRAARKL